MKKMEPNIAKLDRNPTAFAEENDRAANRRRSIMGAPLARWRSTNRARSTAPNASDRSI
jgi:hypothetical protein